MENVLYITPPRIGANIAEIDDICAISVLVLFKSLKLAKSSLATLIWRFSSIPYNA